MKFCPPLTIFDRSVSPKPKPLRPLTNTFWHSSFHIAEKLSIISCSEPVQSPRASAASSALVPTYPASAAASAGVRLATSVPPRSDQVT